MFACLRVGQFSELLQEHSVHL